MRSHRPQQKSRHRLSTFLYRPHQRPQCATENARPKTMVDTFIAMDILTWSYCHSVDVIALCSGDAGYAEAMRRAKTLGLRVEVYAIKSNGQLCASLERHAHHIQDLETLGVLQQGSIFSTDDLHEGYSEVQSCV